jgi:hypothetical protein
VHVEPDAMTVVPYGATAPGARAQPLPRRQPDGTVTDAPIVIHRE